MLNLGIEKLELNNNKYEYDAPYMWTFLGYVPMQEEWKIIANGRIASGHSEDTKAEIFPRWVVALWRGTDTRTIEWEVPHIDIHERHRVRRWRAYKDLQNRGLNQHLEKKAFNKVLQTTSRRMTAINKKSKYRPALIKLKLEPLCSVVVVLFPKPNMAAERIKKADYVWCVAVVKLWYL